MEDRVRFFGLFGQGAAQFSIRAAIYQIRHGDTEKIPCLRGESFCYEQSNFSASGGQKHRRHPPEGQRSSVRER